MNYHPNAQQVISVKHAERHDFAAVYVQLCSGKCRRYYQVTKAVFESGQPVICRPCWQAKMRLN